MATAVVLAAACLLLVAACGSSSKSSTSSGTTATTVPAPTGSPINVGVIGSMTGSQASSSDQFATVAPAWENWVNKSLGGIAGHPVKVFVVDDAGDPAKAQAAEKTLVQQDKVVAIVVGSDNLVSAYDGDAISSGIPVISGPANTADWYTKVGMFPTPTDVLSGLSAQVQVAVKLAKATKFADLYCSEVAACQQADPPLKAAATKAGIGFTSLAVSSTATSYTAQCVQLQQDKVDYAQLNFATAAAVKFVQDCQQQGYNPTWGSSEQAIGPDFAKISGIKMFGPAYAFPSQANAPAANQYRTAMTQYASGSNWTGGTASFTWDGLEVLRQALSGAGTTVTAKDVTDGLNAISNNNLNGQLANKITFTAGKTVAFGGHPCYFNLGIENGKIVAPNNLDPQCVSG